MARRSWPIFLLILLPLIPLWRAVFLGEAIGPWNQINGLVAGTPLPAGLQWDVLQADGAIQFAAWRDLVLSAWRTGDLPLWNPYQLAGTPLAANSQSGAFYPLHILLGLAGVPVFPAITLLAWFHLALLALGLRFLAIQLGASKEGSLIAGILICLSPFVLSWAGLASVVTTSAWIPWLLAGTVLAFRQGTGFPLVALSGGMMILGGHLQFAFYGILASVVFGLCLLILPHDEKQVGKGLLAWIGGGLAALALAWPHLRLVLEFSQQSHRRAPASEEGFQAFSSALLQPFEWVGALNPHFLGTQAVTPLPEKAITTYFPLLAKPGANFAESALTIGPVMIVILVAGFLLKRYSNKDHLPALLLAGLGLAMSGALSPLVGSLINRLFYFGIPGFSATGSPARSLILALLGLCLLAGLLYPHSKVPDPEPKPAEPKGSTLLPLIQGRYGPLVVSLVLCLLILGFSLGLARPQSLLPQVPLDPLISTATASGLLIFFVTLILGAAWLTWRRTIWPAALAAIIAGQALLGATQLVPTGKPELNFPTSRSLDERVAIVRSNWNLFQLPSSGPPPNLASLKRSLEVSGYDSLTSRATAEWMTSLNGGKSPNPPENGNMFFVKPDAETALLEEASVARVYEFRSGEMTTSELNPLPRGFVNGSPAKIVKQSLSSVTIAGRGEITLRDRWSRGWLVRGANGQETASQPGEWIQVSATDCPDANPNECTLTYEPIPHSLLRPWAFASLALFSLLACLCLLSSRPAKPSEKGEDDPNKNALEATNELKP